MRISTQWLRDLVDLAPKIGSKELASALTLAGLEVEGITATDAGDEVLDISITPNRPDALSHMGVAREIAALLQARTRFGTPTCNEQSSSVHDVAHVIVDAKDACLRYACRVIDDVEIKASPEWMQTRLLACGMRPVNNVVDVTNWVMLERGQPLHAYDFAKLDHERKRAVLRVRRALLGEQLIGLDNQTRNLNPDDVVIADLSKPVALAGVIGGKDTEVSVRTNTILLESAYFEPGVVRQMKSRHGLNTEASYRFERGADPNGVLLALDHAAEMIVKVAGGRIARECIDVYPKKVEPVEIALRPKRLAEISGIALADIDERVIRNLLLALGIETIGRKEDALYFRIPTFRPDITREIDLIEEVLRFLGYDKIPVRLYANQSKNNALLDSKFKCVSDILSNALMQAGFFEAVNMSFGSPSAFALFSPEGVQKGIRLINPLGEELSAMRLSLVPGLIANCEHNLRQNRSDVRLFEIGQVFLSQRQGGQAPDIERVRQDAMADVWADEAVMLGMVMTGKAGAEAFDSAPRPCDFYDMKGVVEEMLRAVHLLPDFGSVDFHFEPELNSPFLHPGTASLLVHKAHGALGRFGRLHPDLAEQYDSRNDIWVGEFELDKLVACVQGIPQFQPLARFPALTRDLALLLDEDVKAQAIMDTIGAVDGVKDVLKDVRIFDLYRGKGIAAGKKSLALSLVFRADDRTLTDAEIVQIVDRVIDALRDKVGAAIR